LNAYYLVEPEVAGGWGRNTLFSRTSGQPDVVHRLHYKFDGWLGDELLESVAELIVTERLAAEIEKAGLTGVWFDNVEITKSQAFEDWHPGQELPRFLWMRIVGKPSQDDFWMTPQLILAVSERALDLLKKNGIAHMDVSGPLNEQSEQ
jgi:hypothetical protein